MVEIVPHSYSIIAIKRMIELEIALFRCEELQSRLKTLADSLELVINVDLVKIGEHDYIKYTAIRKDNKIMSPMIDVTKSKQFYLDLCIEKQFDKYSKSVEVNGYEVTDLCADLNPSETLARRTIFNIHTRILEGKIK